MKAVVFDFGYTLVDEDRAWREVAAQYGWPETVLFAALGAVIERRQDHRAVLSMMGAVEPPDDVPFEPEDFYEDALPCLRALKRKGLVLGVAGNMSVDVERFLANQVDVDFLGSSDRWGVSKPDARFFDRIADEVACGPHEIMYVGDRIDNDVLPAQAAGMAAAFLVRGPRGTIQKDWPDARSVSFVITDLMSIFPP